MLPGWPEVAALGAIAVAALSWAYIPKIGGRVGMALVALSLALTAYGKGLSAGRAECNEANLRAEVARLQADLAIARRSAALAEDLGVQLQDAERRAREMADALHTNDDRCRLRPDDLERLRALRKPRAGAKPAARPGMDGPRPATRAEGGR